MKYFKSVETTYWITGTMEDCIIEWAKANNYKVSRSAHFNLTVKINQNIYEVINYKPCKDNMLLVDLKIA